VRIASQASKMVIIPDSAAVADGLSFTVGQITWTTGVNNFTTAATEEVLIRSASTTPATAPATPITHRPLPCYKGRTIDNTDLIEAIDQVDLKLSETLTLVDSIQNQSTEQVQLHHNRSTRPVRTRHPTRFDTDLVVTATPQGRMVCLRPASGPLSTKS
jgi:hypothetical protein